MLKDRIAELTAVRDQARIHAERAQESIAQDRPVTPQALKTFAKQTRRPGPIPAATAAITCARSLSASRWT
jgi:hypothetical protein